MDYEVRRGDMGATRVRAPDYSQKQEGAHARRKDESYTKTRDSSIHPSPVHIVPKAQSAERGG